MSWLEVEKASPGSEFVLIVRRNGIQERLLAVFHIGELPELVAKVSAILSETEVPK